MAQEYTPCYSVRPARSEDLPRITAIDAEANLKRARTLAWLQRQLDGGKFLLVAEQTGSLPHARSWWPRLLRRREHPVAGYLLGSVEQHNDALLAHIADVVVAERHRRRGIARALVERALDEWRTRGVQTVDVYAANAASRALFEGMGFVREQYGWRKYLHPSR